MEETTYELRDLQTADMFPMFKILGKIGFKEFKDAMSPDSLNDMMKAFKGDAGDKESTINYLGFSVVADIAGTVLSHLSDCENDLYSLLSGLSGLKQKDIATLPPATTLQMMVDVVQKPEFGDFFKVVSKLFK